jgi:site-specific DNA-methyltransferase (adenine-specific)
LNRIYQRDCLEGMAIIPDKSIDMILCDLPYGTTACKWDTVIPFDKLWEQYERIIKDNGAIVLTAVQPFTSALIMSNQKLFRYEWVWEKDRHANFLFAKKMPLKVHENICVFYKRAPTYNPIMTKGKPNHTRNTHLHGEESFREGLGNSVKATASNLSGMKYPRTVQYFKCVGKGKNEHPTQKPVELFEYLIKTYTDEGEIVLDNCIGSGTTAVAATRLNRNFIGFERESEYVRIANQRLESVQDELAERKLTEE